MPQDQTIQELNLEEYKYGFVTEGQPVFRAKKGLSEEVVRQISALKHEPAWLLEDRNSRQPVGVRRVQGRGRNPADVDEPQRSHGAGTGSAVGIRLTVPRRRGVGNPGGGARW